MLTQPISMPRLPRFLERILQDPPPAWVVEFAEDGIFRASTANPADVRFEALPGGALVASPVESNLREIEKVEAALRALSLPYTHGRDAQVALVLPDYSVRTSILDFEDFPVRREEQDPLVRFRLRKIVPYDLESARLSFQVFQKSGEKSGVTVVATVCPIHILAEYESLMRRNHCHAGFITTSALAALSLLPADEVSVIAKLSGSVITVALSQSGILRLLRTVELADMAWDELLSVLQPMFALAEDQLGVTVQKLWLCGFDAESAALARGLEKEFAVPASELSSRFGATRTHNAGALGYLQGMGEVIA